MDNFSPHRTMKRIAFIQFYFKAISHPDTKVFVLDEVGFGTSHPRKYSYAPIGQPAFLKSKTLPKNITCCATISEDCVEMVRFFVEGGTKNEVFEEYL